MFMQMTPFLVSFGHIVISESWGNFRDMVYQFFTQVWNRLWKITFFGLKLGKGFKVGPQTPPKSLGSTPPGGGGISCLMISLFFLHKAIFFFFFWFNKHGQSIIWLPETLNRNGYYFVWLRKRRLSFPPLHFSSALKVQARKYNSSTEHVEKKRHAVSVFAMLTSEVRCSV